MAKNYFAVVHNETGKFLLNGSKIPIYWLRKVAQEAAKEYRDYIVQPVNIDDLERLVLKQRNKKAE